MRLYADCENQTPVGEMVPLPDVDDLIFEPENEWCVSAR